MASISLRHIYKVYPNGVKAVSDFNMEVKDKEFIVFVGPSGCGKSTTLRMIAGLEDITAGELFIGDSLVNNMEPKDRDVAMVFQNYALYPHMTVYENMAFGLRLRHVPDDEIHRKVIWAAEILKLTDYLDRKPKAMSGGQRQRVALGRAILRNPKVFLLDEPLSNLDAKLRAEMRTEISKLHEALQTTFVYVTHDQVEAMTMGTRIVVMKLGRVQQIDTPTNLYAYPENKFVAGFIGTPQMNFFDVNLLREGENVKVAFENVHDELIVPFNDMLKVRPAYLTGTKTVTLGIRCENLSLDPEIIAKSKNILSVKVNHFEQLGAENLIYGNLNLEAAALGDSPTAIVIKSYKALGDLKIGDVIQVAFDMKKAHFFDKETEGTIVPRVPETNVFDITVQDRIMSFLGLRIPLPSGIKIPNLPKGELFVPCDAFKLGDASSPFKAKIEGTEKIGDVDVVSLSRNGRTIFVTGEKLPAKGEVSLEFDWKRISVEGNGEEVVKPFPEFDTFLGAFTNLENAKVTNKSLVAFLQKEEKKDIEKLENEKLESLSSFSYQELKRTILLKEHKKAIHDLKEEQSYRIGTEEVGKEGKKRIRKETDEKITLENGKFAALSKKLDEEKAAEEALGSQDKAALEEKKKTVCDSFDPKIAAVKKDYEERIKLVINGVGSMSHIKEEEADASAESAKIVQDLEEELKNKKEACLQDFDTKIEEAKNLYATAEGDKKDDAKIRLASLRTEKNNQMKALVSEIHAKEDSALFSHKKFYAYIDGYGVLTPEYMNSKIVKSLGLSLFKSQFRFEIPHDAFNVESDGRGIEAEVIGMVDFGNEIFLKCISNGTILYPKVKKALPIGTRITLHASLDKAHVVENKFDIRLM